MNEFLDGGEPDSLTFLGKLVRFNHLPNMEPIRVLSVDIDGMLEVEGFSGLFSPGCFTISGEAARQSIQAAP